MNAFKLAIYALRVLILYVQRQKKLLFLLGVSIIIASFIVLKWKENFLRPTITEGLIGTFTEKDLPPTVTNLLSGSLVTLNSSGLPKENIASSWQSNKELTLYTFKLKDNLYWVDGSKLRSQDLDLSLADVEVRTPDDLTLEFKIVDSFSPFPTLLTKPVFKKNTNQRADIGFGIGPYRIESIQKDQIFVKKLRLKPLDKKMPDIIVRFYPNENVAKNALKLGEIQVLLGVFDIGSYSQEKTLSVISKSNFAQLVTIFYNTKDSVLSDENLRLALSFAAPSIKGETEAKTSLSPKSWAYNNEVKDYLDNQEQAKLYFSKIQNQDKIKNSKDPVVTLTSTSSLESVGEKVVDAWKKTGIKAVLRTESGVPQNFQALLIAQNIPSDPDQYSLWHSTQTQTNISKFSSPRVDKDLEDGRKSNDLETRKQKYQDFQKVLLDHAPATFLYFPKYNVVYRKKIDSELKKIIGLQLKTLFDN